MKEILTDHHRRMAELITAEPELVHILQRLGIALGFGDKTIAQVCEMHHVDVEFFMLIVNIYTHKHFVPEQRKILSIPMEQLVPYLRLSHTYYTSKRLPHIERHLHHIAEQLPPKVAQVFLHFFEEYKRDVAEHFAHEETTVFPHVEALQNRKSDQGYSISAFVDSHGNLVDKLADLLQIIFKYLPQSVTTDDAVDVVYDILQVSDDLTHHGMIEEMVLVPYVQHLEKMVK